VAYIFPFKIVPAIFSDLSIDYKRAEENGVIDKIKKQRQLPGQNCANQENSSDAKIATRLICIVGRLIGAKKNF
jgi:hypothetical protein